MEEVLELSVTDLARGGAGVARDAGGRVVFIPFTAPGDRVRVRIVEDHKRYAQGELLELLEASPVRQTPPCPAFTRCGGCQWQHLPYDLQWKTKVDGVRHALRRVQVDVPEPLGELPADRIWEYRNRVQVRGEGEAMGFHAPGTNTIVPIDRCAIARPEINARWSETRNEGRARPESRYKVEMEVLPDGQFRRTWNARHGAGGFRQVHDEQNDKLRSWVGEAVTAGRPLLDLFGGAGNLSLPLVNRMTRIDCVDVSVPRERPAGLLETFRFHRSPVTPWLVRAAAAHRPASATAGLTATLDPPRIGLGAEFNEIEPALRTLGVDELILVGCDPDAWARDLSRFTRRGWVLRKAAVLDLFPQTAHVEALARLVRPEFAL